MNILLLNNLRVAQATGYNSYLQAVIDRATALSYTIPGSTILNKLNARCDAIGDEWDNIEYCYMMDYSGFDDFKSLDYKNPTTLQYTASAGVVFGSTGATGNGSTTFIDTNWSTSIQSVVTLDSSSMFLFYANNAGIYPKADYGVYALSGVHSFFRLNSSTTLYYGDNFQGGTPLLNKAYTAATADFSMHIKQDGVNQSVYQDGAEIVGSGGTLTQRTITDATTDYLLARNFRNSVNLPSANTLRVGIKGNHSLDSLILHNAINNNL